MRFPLKSIPGWLVSPTAKSVGLLIATGVVAYGAFVFTPGGEMLKGAAAASVVVFGIMASLYRKRAASSTGTPSKKAYGGAATLMSALLLGVGFGVDGGFSALSMPSLPSIPWAKLGIGVLVALAAVVGFALHWIGILRLPSSKKGWAAAVALTLLAIVLVGGATMKMAPDSRLGTVASNLVASATGMFGGDDAEQETESASESEPGILDNLQASASSWWDGPHWWDRFGSDDQPTVATSNPPPPKATAATTTAPAKAVTEPASQPAPQKAAPAKVVTAPSVTPADCLNGRLDVKDTGFSDGALVAFKATYSGDRYPSEPVSFVHWESGQFVRVETLGVQPTEWVDGKGMTPEYKGNCGEHEVRVTTDVKPPTPSFTGWAKAAKTETVMVASR
jgi:hypothetical protein